MKKIIIASDSFKGSLSSVEVARAVGAGIRKVLPDCRVVSVPVADGGEGTVEAMVTATKGEIVVCRVHDPLMNIIEARYGILGDGNTAIIEMAAASGLPLVAPDRRNPMETTTYGTGELIKDALVRGCANLLIGIGGSATNDAATGMLQALGFRFLGEDGIELGQGGKILEHIVDIDTSRVEEQVLNAEYTVACDVNNPFSGANGAAYVFAPQKGAGKATVEILDAGMKHFASVIYNRLHIDVESIEGAGAAGGMGGGFAAFLGASLTKGVDMVLEALDFEGLITGADLIITGEGKLDRQTAMGKAVMGVLSAARRQNIPVVAIGGQVEDKEMLDGLGFEAVLPVFPYPVPLEQAMRKDIACENIGKTIEAYLRGR